MQLKEKFKTFKHVFDQFTEKNLFKLQSQGYFEHIESPISIGKEGNIFTAHTAEGERVIIKIYRLSTCDFNKMYTYLRADPRTNNVKRSSREIIFTWAHREYRNLHKARDARVRVPTPHTQFMNILIMQYIGDEESPAQKLKDKPPKKPKEFLKELLKQLNILYHKAKLVHTDLSPYNILNHNEKPVIIDMSQATPLDNPNVQEYLERDCKNLANAFNKYGVNIKQEEIKKAITGKNK